MATPAEPAVRAEPPRYERPASPVSDAAPPAGDDVRADDAPPAATEGPPDLPRDTTPTWEVELLVSGIVLVGLMQLPPWLHDIWARRAPHLSLIGSVAGSTVTLVVSAALYALIGCFLVHLALRGYWVALVGANSVFPGGVRWDKQREYGPIQTEEMQRRVRPLPEFIARADNTASLVFATGFVLAAGALASLVAIAGLLAVGALLLAVLPAKVALVAFGSLSAVIGTAFTAAAAIDMRYGARLDPAGRPVRVLRTLLRASSAFTPAGVRSLSAVLMSNVDKRVAYAAAIAGLGGAYVSARGTVLSDTDVPGASNYTFFDERAHAGVVSADFYDSLRGDAAAAGAPSIQSDVVTDPYVRLFVPYRPVRHDAALRRACPGLRPPDDGDEDSGTPATDAAVLACAGRLHAVTLDGRPVAAAFRFFTNPRTERRGFLMLIPATGLAPGEHVLTVTPAMRDAPVGPTPPIRIPFWR